MEVEESSFNENVLQNHALLISLFHNPSNTLSAYDAETDHRNKVLVEYMTKSFMAEMGGMMDAKLTGLARNIIADTKEIIAKNNEVLEERFLVIERHLNIKPPEGRLSLLTSQKVGASLNLPRTQEPVVSQQQDAKSGATQEPHMEEESPAEP